MAASTAAAGAIELAAAAVSAALNSATAAAAAAAIAPQLPPAPSPSWSSPPPPTTQFDLLLSSASIGYQSTFDIDDSQVCEIALSWSLRKYAQARESVLREAGFWVFAALYGPAGLVGIVGNALTIYVFAAKMRRTPTSAFIIALAVVDLCVCLVVIPSRFAAVLLINFGFDALCKGSEAVYFVALPTSGFLLVAIAVDRFVLICLARSDLVTRRAVRAALVLTLLAGLVIGLPSALTVSVYQDTANAHGNATLVCLTGLCKPTHKYISQRAAWDYWVAVATLFIVMAIVLAALYLMIFLRVLSARRSVGRWAAHSTTTTTTTASDTNAGAGGCGRRSSSRRRSSAGGSNRIDGSECDGCARRFLYFFKRGPGVAAAYDGCCSGARSDDAPQRASAGGSRAAAAAAANADATDAHAPDGANPAASLLSVPRRTPPPAEAASARGALGRAAANSWSLSNAPSAAGCGGGGGGEQDSFAAAPSLAAAGGGGSSKRAARKKRMPHVNTAVTLCLVTGTFIVAYLPVIVITLSGACSDESDEAGDGGGGAGAASAASGAGCEPHNVYGVLWHFFLFNHVVNPIIYAFMNPRFKEALCSALPRSRGQRPRFFIDGHTQPPMTDGQRSSIEWQSGAAAAAAAAAASP